MFLIHISCIDVHITTSKLGQTAVESWIYSYPDTHVPVCLYSSMAYDQ